MLPCARIEMAKVFSLVARMLWVEEITSLGVARRGSNRSGKSVEHSAKARSDYVLRVRLAIDGRSDA
jgi:hypothetical protein